VVLRGGGVQSHALGTRQLAGVLIKNSFSARGLQLGVERRQRWATLAADAKRHIRATLLQALGSHAPEVRHTSAQVVGTVALMDLPQGHWDDLLPSLVRGVGSAAPALRQVGAC